MSMLTDLIADQLVSPRNRGILAGSAALVLGGCAAKLASMFRVSDGLARLAGVGVVGVLGMTWWPTISVAAADVLSTTTSITTTVAEIEPLSNVALRCGGVEPVLSTIRTLESANQYGRLNGSAHTGATASGAYQYTNGTWDGYGGYRRAMDAPPEVQDERARGDVTRFLAQHNNDVSVIPALWYIGHVPTAAEWDQIPWQSQGNTLTPRQYQRKWLAEYERQTAACSTEAK